MEKSSVQIIILLVCLSISNSLFAQIPNEPWYSFVDTTKELVGFNDALGRVMIPAKLVHGFTVADKFEDIMAVIVQDGDNWSPMQYQLKSGEIVGVDSVYLWDNTPDCEIEGHIRFRDKKKDKVGFFDRNGKVVIPAIYNDAQPFKNGYSAVKKNASKKCWDGAEYSKENRCEHWSWKGGSTLLINEQNEVIIDNIKSSKVFEYDYGSIRNEKAISLDSVRDYYENINGDIHSIIDHQKQFKKWLKSEFLNDPMNVNNYADAISFWSVNEKKWIQMKREEFLITNESSINKYFNKLSEQKENLEIFIEDINPYIHFSIIKDEYFDNCRHPISWKYPVFNVVTSYYNEFKSKTQDSIKFLKTDEGYKLIQLSLRSLELE